MKGPILSAPRRRVPLRNPLAQDWRCRSPRRRLSQAEIANSLAVEIADGDERALCADLVLSKISVARLKLERPGRLLRCGALGRGGAVKMAKGNSFAAKKLRHAFSRIVAEQIRLNDTAR